MTRCNTCNGIVTKTDTNCFTCNEPVNGTGRGVGRRKGTPKTKLPAQITPVTNLLFMASLVLTGVSFLSSQKMPLPVSAGLSGLLLLARVVTDRRMLPVPQRRKTDQLPPELLKRMTLG